MQPKHKLTRVKDAYVQLKQQILTNELPAGFQATEPEYAMRLGMSRTPVREALIRLEAERLVELIPRRGVRVLPVQADDMAEIYELLTAVEPEAAASLARRKPSLTELQPLSDLTSKMEEALGVENLDAWAEADDKFHRTLLEMHGNQRLLDMVSVLFDQAHRARLFTLRLRELPVKSTEDHRKFVELIHLGEADAVHTLFREHRQRSATELLGILKKFNLGQL